MRLLHSALSVACLTGLASASSAQSIQQVLLPPAPEATSEEFGSDVCSVSDVNGDGVADFAIVVPRPIENDPSVRVFSGADRSILLSLDLVALIASDSIRIADGGDQDGDGVSELLVGQKDYGDGIVQIYSLRTGELVRVHFGGSNNQLGASVAGVGDLDGDGFADYAAGAPLGGLLGSGAVYVYSGDTGTLLHTQLNPDFAGTSRIGRSLAAAGDVNGDGVQDIITGGSYQALLFSAVPPVLISQQLTQEASFGVAVTGLGDLNGDGRDDYAVGMPGWDIPGPPPFGTEITDVGSVLVYAGPPTGGTPNKLWSVNGDAAFEKLGLDLARLPVPGPDRVLAATGGHAELFHGTSGSQLATFAPYASLGFSIERDVRVDVIPDVSGDFREDLLIGAGDANLGSTGGIGRVELYSGVSGYGLLDRLWSRSGQNSGAAVALLGDVDGDGVADTAVGAPHDDELALYDGGTVRVRSGATGAELWCYRGPDGAQAGTSLLVLPDQDGDGVNDLAVGCPRRDNAALISLFPARDGSVAIVSGATGAELLNLKGKSGGELYGSSLALVGDVDGDGVGDIAVGAPGHKNAGVPGEPRGRFEIRSGATGADLGEPHPSLHGGRTGTALAGLGDVNGNGIPDVAVGAPGLDRVRVLELPKGPVLWTVTGVAGFEDGAALAALGDVDGDGVRDLAAGGPLASAFGATIGRVRVLSGASGQLLNELAGTVPGARFGASVAGVGDVDKDGVTDVAVGSPGASNGLSSLGAGRVEIFRGLGPTAPLRRWLGTNLDQRLGASLASGLDINDDGIWDLAAGAPGWDDTLGSTQVLNARAKFTTPYGSGTDGCDGQHLLVAGMPPELGTLLELRGTNAAPGGIVFGLYSLGQDVPGTDWGFGFLLHVGLFQHFLTLNGVADSEGRVTFPLPLPNAPNLVGAKLHTQAVYSFAGAPCSQLPLLVSSSHGLTLTLHE